MNASHTSWRYTLQVALDLAKVEGLSLFFSSQVCHQNTGKLFFYCIVTGMHDITLHALNVWLTGRLAGIIKLVINFNNYKLSKFPN